MIVAAGPNVRAFDQPPLLIGSRADDPGGARRAKPGRAHPAACFHELVGSEAGVTKAAPAVQIPGMPTGEETSSVSDTEADEMEEHLRGLGYLE